MVSPFLCLTVNSLKGSPAIGLFFWPPWSYGRDDGDDSGWQKMMSNHARLALPFFPATMPPDARPAARDSGSRSADSFRRCGRLADGLRGGLRGAAGRVPEGDPAAGGRRREAVGPPRRRPAALASRGARPDPVDV